MTPLSSIEYVQIGGVRCPFCADDDIEGKSLNVDQGGASQKIGCNACGKIWWDLYTLTGYEPIED